MNIPQLAVLEKSAGINWQLVFQIRKLLKKHNINLIHAHCEFSQLYAGLAGFTCGIKTVATFHRSDLSKYEPSKVNSLIKFLASKYIAVSYDRLSLLTDNLNLPRENCHVVHGGANIEEIPTPESIKQARETLSLDEDEIVLVSVGHLGEIKGHQDTISALSNLIEQAPNLHLYIAGDGSVKEKKKLETLIQDKHLGSNVTFLGQINNVTTWLEACDIFVQPSIEEAFGLVFVEAGAKAKPVVATNVGGIKEIIIHDETGLLVPPASPDKLKTALEQLISKPEDRARLGTNGYQRVLKEFSLPSMVKRYTEIFNKVI